MAHSGVDRTTSEGEKIDRKKDICFAEIVLVIGLYPRRQQIGSLKIAADSVRLSIA